MKAKGDVGVRRRLRWLVFGAAAVAAVGLAACERAADRADLVFINGAEPETLDPAIITGQPEGRVVGALFEGLLRFDKTGRVVPGMAESWEVSDDGLRYRFRIRGDARWSDGKPVTAEDFVRSWQRTLTPETGSLYNYQLYYIRNARPFAEGELEDFAAVGVRAPDARTLEVELEAPTPFFLQLCAFPTLFPVRVDVIDRVGDGWVKPEHIVTNGTYRLADWRINDRIRLERNADHWDAESIRLDTVDILPISDANTAMNFYISGQADLVMDKGLAPPSLLDDLMRRSDFHSAPFLGTYFLRYHCGRPPFDDPKVRDAFSLVVDKERIVRAITRAGEKVARGLVPPLEGYPPVEGPQYDPERARGLLAEAGFPGGEGFPLSTYLYTDGELNQAIAVELQSMWRRELGVDVNLVRKEWRVYLNSLSSLDYSIARSSWVGDYADANTFLDMFVTGGGNNRTGWSSAEYDRLIAAAARTADPRERIDILRRAEELLVGRGSPICPLFFYVGIQLYDPDKLGGIVGNILDEHPIHAIYRKDAGEMNR